MLNKTVEDLTSTTHGLDSRWFSEDLTSEDKDKTKQVLLNSSIQFRLLKKILREEFKTHSLKPSDFDKPNLDQRLIYNEGYVRALQEIYRILP